MSGTHELVSSDYRASHLHRGATYDSGLAQSPWDDYLARAEAHILEGVLRDVVPGPIGRALDFACGTGRITRQLEAHTFETWGVDVSASMLEQAQSRCRRTLFRRVDITREPLETGRFDVATAFRFFGNAQPELRAAALRALNRLMRPGGWLVIDNHRNPLALAPLLRRATGGEVDRDLTHARLRSLLSSTGFRLVWQRPIGAWIYRDSLFDERLRRRNPAAFPEVLFKHSGLVSVAPAAVLVARKERGA